ncbi:hypothetical protein F5X96DRAFT_642084 [Biscogniauxia mediterranea]|nr:hypothetical protein F5X96DRAFT_642084 [Biscogniauxia mediterranea]
MTEGVQSPEDAAAARAAEQARLRKERREAKIKAGGAARLNKITGLGGGIQRDPQPQPVSEPAPNPTPVTSDQHADPDEVDISQHYYEPKTSTRPPTGDGPDISEAQLRQMMLGLDRPVSPGIGQPPMPGMEGMEGMQDDPMMQMLSRMMGGGMPGAAGPGGANPFAGTGMEGLFGAGGNPFQQQQQQQVQQSSKTANLWRILHAIFALGLGLYVALATTFSGTQAEREHDSVIQASGLLGDSHSVEKTRANFFYIFTSVEAVLLTTRFFMDTTREPPSGWLWTISGFLPDPAKGYVRHVLRYGQIFSTVRNDALFCVFVMGVCCLLRT